MSGITYRSRRLYEAGKFHPVNISVLPHFYPKSPLVLQHENIPALRSSVFLCLCFTRISSCGAGDRILGTSSSKGMIYKSSLLCP
jgi:hypothetical protein